MLFHVKSAEDASEALSYFNHFHDGFIESMAVTVVAEHPDGFGFGLPVRHDATIRLVHWNYRAAQKLGLRQHRIGIRLTRVSKVNIGNMTSVDNMLQECRIEVDGDDGLIRLDVGGDGLVTFTCEGLEINDDSTEPW